MKKLLSALTFIFAVYFGVIQPSIANAGTRASASIDYNTCESYCWDNFGDDYGTGIFNNKYYTECAQMCLTSL